MFSIVFSQPASFRVRQLFGISIAPGFVETNDSEGAANDQNRQGAFLTNETV